LKGVEPKKHGDSTLAPVILPLNSPALSEMCKAYGGNAKAMEILCGAIQTDYEVI
jgi:hypothetical protein